MIQGKFFVVFLPSCFDRFAARANYSGTALARAAEYRQCIELSGREGIGWLPVRLFWLQGIAYRFSTQTGQLTVFI